jgi:hypothetical protein
MLKSSIVIGIVAAVLVALTAGPASSAASAQCGAQRMGQGPSNDRSLPIGHVVATNMSCRAAHAAIRNGTFNEHGCFLGPNSRCETHFKTRGFRCTAPRLGAFRCVGHARRFSFAWSE